MSPPRILLFGANGSLGRLIAAQVLSRDWHIVSVVRREAQRHAVLESSASRRSQHQVVVADLEEMTWERARGLIQDNMPDYVVWAAGSMSNPMRVDCDAAKHLIKASVQCSRVSRFLMISFPASRQKRAPWWNEHDWQAFLQEKVNYPDIAKAKNEADEYLVGMAHARRTNGDAKFNAISLRPSWLSNEEPTGVVTLGQTKSIGTVSRGDVASVTVALLSRDDASGWFDLLAGRDTVDVAVEKAVRDGLQSITGEDLEAMYAKADAF